jgi:hypothetical protein
MSAPSSTARGTVTRASRCRCSSNATAPFVDRAPPCVPAGLAPVLSLWVPPAAVGAPWLRGAAVREPSGLATGRGAQDADGRSRRRPRRMACLAERRPFTAPNNLHEATELLPSRSALIARQPARGASSPTPSPLPAGCHRRASATPARLTPGDGRPVRSVTAGLRGAHDQRDRRGPVPIAFGAFWGPGSSPGSRISKSQHRRRSGGSGGRSSPPGYRWCEGGRGGRPATCGRRWEACGRGRARLVRPA